MYSYTVTKPSGSIVLGGYTFSHSGGYNADGSYIIWADTEEHLTQIVNDIENGSIPDIPSPVPSAEAQRIDELETALAELMLFVVMNL